MEGKTRRCSLGNIAGFGKKGDRDRSDYIIFF
jgi:hypothetical protein